MREYELIHEVQFGIHYKKWVPVKAKAQYCGCDVFLYRRPVSTTSIITHWATGSILVMAKCSPYPAAIVECLDKNLTGDQLARLRSFSGRLVTAKLYKDLCGLPTYHQALPAIQAAREESWRLEGIITGQDLPW